MPPILPETQVDTAADASQYAYGGPTPTVPSGYTPIDAIDDPSSGFHLEILQSNADPGAYIFTFAGTDPGDLSDVATDFTLGSFQWDANQAAIDGAVSNLPSAHRRFKLAFRRPRR